MTSNIATDDNLPTGFMVVQSNRMEDLCKVYVQWLKRYPVAPLAAEVLLTQSNGIAQWLKQTLAQDDIAHDQASTDFSGCGIAAGIDAMLPAQFVWRCYCALLPNLSPLSVYDKKALTWRFYRLLATWDLTALAPLLSSYVGNGATPKDQLSLAKQLADLYDQYQIFRPDWLTAWQQSKDVMGVTRVAMGVGPTDAGTDTLTGIQQTQKTIPKEQQWQAKIWRALCEDINHQDDFLGWSPDSRIQLHQRFLDACAQPTWSPQNRPQGLPARVVVFGLSSLPISTLEALRAIAPFTQVLLFIMNPSQYYWGDMVQGRDLLKQAYKRQSKRQGIDKHGIEHAYGNPLLAAWGKQGRDFLHLCDEQDLPSTYKHYFDTLPQGKIDLFSATHTDDGTATPSLLSTIQDDILHLRSANERADMHSTLDTKDNSVQFISAHSRQREVEVLQDQLLADFADSHSQNTPTAHCGKNPLQPKDILVMVPDIVAYAPHIDAVFGRYKKTKGGHFDTRYLPYHITDTGERYANPVLAAYRLLLNLPHERLTSSQGFELLEVPACQSRFGITNADFGLIKRWIKGSNIRWALDETHRHTLGVPSQGQQNTWQFGVDRLLLGYLSGDQLAKAPNNDSMLWQGIMPYAEVSGLNGELLGKLSHFIARLQHWQQQLQHPHTPAQWVPIMLDLWRDFFDQGVHEESLYLRMEEHLQQWLATTEQAQADALLLPVELVSSELFDQLEQTNLSCHFMTGAINFATLMPMRAVPFRQIWLLGMNDQEYPRQRPYNDFDLMTKDYRVGDRSRREDDRYLFLEALLSARDKLVISWHGRNIKDDSKQPPSVLVAQLQDYLNKGWPVHLEKQGHEKQGHEKQGQAEHAPQQPTQTLSQRLTRTYPLQAFSAHYFQAPTDSDQFGHLFTYANEWQPSQVPATKATNNVLSPWLPERSLHANDLSQCLKSPVEALYKQRFAISKAFAAETLDTTETFAIDGLATWRINNDLITNHINPHDSTRCVARQVQNHLIQYQQTGQLLSGDAGMFQSQTVQDNLVELFSAYQKKCADYQTNAALPVFNTHPSQQTTHAYQAQHLVDGQNVSVDIALPHLRHKDAFTGSNLPEHHQQWLVQAHNAMANNKPQYTHISYGWVCHIAAHLYCQAPVDTFIFSPKGQVHLLPLIDEHSNHQAQQYFQQLLNHWLQAMHGPLPISLAMGELLATFVKKAPDHRLLAADLTPHQLDQLMAAYEADAKRFSSWFFQRHFMHLDSMDITHSITLAKHLYLPMIQHTKGYQ